MAEKVEKVVLRRSTRTRSRSRDTRFSYADIESPKRKSSNRRSRSEPRVAKAKGSQDENAVPRKSVAKKKSSLKSKSTPNLAEAEVDDIAVPRPIELDSVVKEEFPKLPTTSKPLATKNTNVTVKQVHPPACSSSASTSANVTARNPVGRPRRPSVQEKNHVSKVVTVSSKVQPVIKLARRQSTVSAPQKQKPPAAANNVNTGRKVVINLPMKNAPANPATNSVTTGSLVGYKVLLNKMPSTSSSVTTASGSQPKVFYINSPKNVVTQRNLSTIPEVSPEASVNGNFFPGACSTPRVYGPLTVTVKNGDEMKNLIAKKDEEIARLKIVIQKQTDYNQLQKEHFARKESALKDQLITKEQNIQKLKIAFDKIIRIATDAKEN